MELRSTNKIKLSERDGVIFFALRRNNHRAGRKKVRDIRTSFISWRAINVWFRMKSVNLNKRRRRCSQQWANAILSGRGKTASVNGRGLRTRNHGRRHKNATLGDFTLRTEMPASFRTARLYTVSHYYRIIHLCGLP